MRQMHAIDYAALRVARAAAEPQEDDFGGEPDFCHRVGANALKLAIEEYWRKRGHEVQIMLIEAQFNPAIRSARVDVRSDMVSGWPRRFTLPSPENNNG